VGWNPIAEVFRADQFGVHLDHKWMASVKFVRRATDEPGPCDKITSGSQNVIGLGRFFSTPAVPQGIFEKKKATRRRPFFSLNSEA
jgi:hypothetical protein